MVVACKMKLDHDDWIRFAINDFPLSKTGASQNRIKINLSLTTWMYAPGIEVIYIWMTFLCIEVFVFVDIYAFQFSLHPSFLKGFACVRNLLSYLNPPTHPPCQLHKWIFPNCRNFSGTKFLRLRTSLYYF